MTEITDPEVVEAAAAVETGATPETLCLHSGVVLRLRPIPPGLLRKAAARVPVPEVPTIWLEDKERKEENPNDPAYLAALAERGEKQALAQMDVAILYGTSIDKVPKGVAGPDDEEWSKDLLEDGFLQEEDLKSHRKRYLNWILLYAIRGSDEAKLFSQVIALCGLTEVEVQEMMASFRSRGLRGADPGQAHEGGD